MIWQGGNPLEDQAITTCPHLPKILPPRDIGPSTMLLLAMWVEAMWAGRPPHPPLPPAFSRQPTKRDSARLAPTIDCSSLFLRPFPALTHHPVEVLTSLRFNILMQQILPKQTVGETCPAHLPLHQTVWSNFPRCLFPTLVRAPRRGEQSWRDWACLIIVTILRRRRRRRSWWGRASGQRGGARRETQLWEWSCLYWTSIALSPKYPSKTFQSLIPSPHRNKVEPSCAFILKCKQVPAGQCLGFTGDKADLSTKTISRLLQTIRAVNISLSTRCCAAPYPIPMSMSNFDTSTILFWQFACNKYNRLSLPSLLTFVSQDSIYSARCSKKRTDFWQSTHLFCTDLRLVSFLIYGPSSFCQKERCFDSNDQLSKTFCAGLWGSAILHLCLKTLIWLGCFNHFKWSTCPTINKYSQLRKLISSDNSDLITGSSVNAPGSKWLLPFTLVEKMKQYCKLQWSVLLQSQKVSRKKNWGGWQKTKILQNFASTISLRLVA